MSIGNESQQSLDALLDRMYRAEDTLKTAGEALDAAMKQLVTDGSIIFLRHPEMVERLHQALNRVVAITGTPWRETQGAVDAQS